MSVKNILIFSGITIVCMILASLDIFGLKPIDSTNIQNTAIQFFYFIPCLLYMVFAYTATKYGRRSVAPEEKAEKIKSLIRSGIQIAGTVLGLAAAFNLDIPIINQLRQTLGYLSENIDVAENAILALIGVVVTIIGFFKNPNRFADRGEVIEGKELKVNGD